jgi:hypothetical protein
MARTKSVDKAKAEAESPEIPGVDNNAEIEGAGKREAAIEGEAERIDAIGEDAELNIGTLGADITQAALDIYRTRRFRWDEMSKLEQRDIAQHIDWAVKATLRRAVQLIAANGRDGILAKLEKFADKGGEITLSMKIAAADEATIVALHRASNKEVMIVAADAADLLNPRPGEADEQELAFEAGSDEHPADDSDLAGEAQPQGAAEIVRHGDVIEFAGDTGRARIDLNTGMIELVLPDEDSVDFRPATADELAAERDRRADDFSDEVDEDEQIPA